MTTLVKSCLAACLAMCLATSAFAGPFGLVHGPFDRTSDTANAADAPAITRNSGTPDTFAGRDILLHVPSQLPPAGKRSLVVALHGGGGNAGFMQSHLNMDEIADKDGFIVAYLNGTSAAPMLPGSFKAWNAGDCCAQPVEKNIDDVGYITNTTAYLAQKYGIAPGHIYAIAHSNGSIMAQRMVCQTGVFAAATTLSGPLSQSITQCPAASGKRILAIHGAQDQNVPVAGGVGTKGPESAKKVAHRSEASAKAQFESEGASYTIHILPDVDHALAHLDDAMRAQEHIGVAQKAAQFFGLESNP